MKVVLMQVIGLFFVISHAEPTALFARDNRIGTGLINRLQLEQHRGSRSWNGSDIGVTGNTLLLKWSSK